MKLLKVAKKALDQYRDTAKGNRYVSDDQAIRKLTRNVQLVIETAPERITKGFISKTYSYGNLDIVVIRNTIVKVVNHKGESENWKFPKSRYIQLNEQLGITDCKYKSKKSNKKAVNT